MDLLKQVHVRPVLRFELVDLQVDAALGVSCIVALGTVG